MNDDKKHIFKIGDKAVLDIGFGFTKGDCCLMYVEQGAEVTIRKVFGEVCEVEFDGATSLVNSYYLTPVQTEVKIKFKAGDKVRCHALGADEYFDGVVVSYKNQYGATCYGVLDTKTNQVVDVDFDNCVTLIDDEQPKDITERIKSFEDACEWCKSNYRPYLVNQYNLYKEAMVGEVCEFDLLAYLKLRIITCALNEGWEPTFDEGEDRYAPSFYKNNSNSNIHTNTDSWDWYTIDGSSSAFLTFKSESLAYYAAKQFKSIYMDFCYKSK